MVCNTVEHVGMKVFQELDISVPIVRHVRERESDMFDCILSCFTTHPGIYLNIYIEIQQTAY